MDRGNAVAVAVNTFWEWTSEIAECRPRALTDSCLSMPFDKPLLVEPPSRKSESREEMSTDAESSSSSASWSDDEAWQAPPGVWQAHLEGFTTLMLKQLPEGSTQATILQFLHSLGLSHTVDFLYAPTNFRKDVLFGYCFLNFVDHVSAVAAMRKLQETTWPGRAGSVQVAWSETYQGLAAQIERYRNCPIMHKTVPEKVKPMLLCCGQVMTFPPPTSHLEAPRNMKKGKCGQA